MKLAAAALLPLLACAARAAPPAALDLVALRVPVLARVAPGGDAVLAVIVEPGAGRREWRQAIWRLGPGQSPSELVAGAGAPRWAPDGRAFAYLVRDPSGRQLWRADADGGRPRRLGALAGGVDDYAWSPDGRQLAAIGPQGAGEDRRPQIHLVDAETGESRQLTAVAFHIVVSPWDPEGNLSWSPDGRRIAFAGKPSARFDDDYRSDLYAVEIATGALSRLTRRDGMDLRPAWSPDGRWIAFRTTFGRVDRYANHGLALVSADGAQIVDAGASLELGFLDGPYWHAWTADSRRLLFAAPERAAIHLFALEIATRAVEPITRGDAAHVRPSLSRDGSTLVFLRSDPHTPWDVWSQPVEGGPPARLATLNPGLDPAAAYRYERRRWRAEDGLEIEGLLARPAAATGRVPVVVYLHGGPEGMAYHGFEPEVPIPAAELHVTPPWFYTARGWAVFYPNFRGSGGYGERLRRAATRDWSAGFAGDVLRGVDHLIAQGIADPRRLFLVGSWRSGSTKVLSLLSRTKAFAAAAALSAYPDVEALARRQDDFHLQHDALFGGSAAEAPEEWRRQSPIHSIGEIRTPLLLVHDENDFAVPAEQSLEVHRRLLAAGVPGGLVLYRSRDLRDDAALVETLYRWFAQHAD